jgi:hypothetical protein
VFVEKLIKIFLVETSSSDTSSSIVQEITREVEVEETTLPLETSTESSTTTSTTVSQGTRRFPLRRRKKQKTTKSLN